MLFQYSYNLNFVTPSFKRHHETNYKGNSLPKLKTGKRKGRRFLLSCRNREEISGGGDFWPKYIPRKSLNAQKSLPFAVLAGDVTIVTDWDPLAPGDSQAHAAD